MTQEQHIASDPYASAWVAANAGTGKTKVLCDRVLRLLLSGVDPSRILCLTYTKAAAAEMKNRVYTELAAWVGMEDSALSETLHRLMGMAPATSVLQQARVLFASVLDAPEGVRMHTLHGFCQSLLRRFPLEAKLSPHFTVIDERTSAELLREATQRLFTQTMGKAHHFLQEAIAEIAAVLGEEQFHELLKNLVQQRKSIIRLIKAQGGIIRHNTRLYERLGVSYGLKPDMLYAQHFSTTPEAMARLQSAISVLREGKMTDQKLADAIETWCNSEKTLQDAQHYVSAYLTQQDRALRKNLPTKDIRETYPAVAEMVAQEAHRARTYIELESALRLARSSEYFMAVAEAMLELYAHLKTVHGAMDYDDLILSAQSLLARPGIAPWVLYKLDGGLDHLLIDEAQDTSMEQWAIVKTLTEEFFAGVGQSTEERTLFVVGDEKQSIYRFQGASPEAFGLNAQHFAQAATQAGKPFHIVQLEQSFRSTEAILAVVDAVFANPAARAGLTTAETGVHHAVHRTGQGGKVELWPLIFSEEKEQHGAWEVATKAVYNAKPSVMLAQRIAMHIDTWLQEGRMLVSHARPVHAGDIIILVRNRGALMGQLVRALKQKSIPVAGVDRLLITEHIAVMDLMALARFVLLPEDDLNLACLLKSPLLGVTEEELFILAHDRAGALWEALQKRETAHADILTCLRGWLSLADYITPYALFSQVLHVEGGRRKFVARMGEEVNDPLDEFLALAMEFERSHIPTLHMFLHWLESGQTEIKRDQEHASGQVRIMTVHGAKGLQAPIVFLVDTVSLPDIRKQRIVFDEEEGEYSVLWPEGQGAKTPLCVAVKERLLAAEYEEYRRLLYVAMTRAEDELYICGYSGRKKISDQCWYALAEDALKTIGMEVPWMAEETCWRYETPQNVPATSRSEIMSRTPSPAPLPEFATLPAPVEPVLPRPLVPSRNAEHQETTALAGNMAARTRGTLFHRMLQYAPDIPLNQREETLRIYLERYVPEWPEAMRESALREIGAILEHPQFAPVFGEGSRAEVPITGTIHAGGTFVLSGQIDRLVVNENKVLVVDFKTNLSVPQTLEDVPIGYIRQLAAYRTALQEIYPRHAIACALLWTTAPLLMEVPDWRFASP